MLQEQFLEYLKIRSSKELELPYLSQYVLKMAIQQAKNKKKNSPSLNEVQFYSLIYAQWKINTSHISEKDNFMQLFYEIDALNIFVSDVSVG